jgi:hypothetical protein
MYNRFLLGELSDLSLLSIIFGWRALELVPWRLNFSQVLSVAFRVAQL